MTTLYLISIKELSEYIEHILAPHHLNLHYTYCLQDYLFELAEELRFSFTDYEAVSASDRATIYLSGKGIPAPLARSLSWDMLQSLLDIISSHLPKMRYIDLARCGYVIQDVKTLGVRFP